MLENSLSEAILKEFRPQIEEIARLLSMESGHFIICYLDRWILDTVLSYLKKASQKRIVDVSNAKASLQPFEKDVVFIVNVDELRTLSQQTIVYNLLEASRINVNLVLTSRSCMCVENFERRIRSRFNNKVVFLQYLSTEAVKLFVGDDEEISRTTPSCEEILKEHLRKKYSLKRYELRDMYNMLTPLHICILIMCTKRGITYANVAEEFKKLTMRCRELRNVKDTDVLSSYFDILDSGLLDKKGGLLFDLEDLKGFIRREAPLYLRNLIK